MSLIRKIFAAFFLVWGLLVFVAFMLLLFPFIILIQLLFKGKKAQQLSFVCLRIWAKAIAVLCLYRIRFKNKEEVDTSKAYIYVCNHGSYLDAVSVVLATPQAFKPLGKIEMVKAPIFGTLYKKLVVMVDRTNPESRAKSVEALKADIADGQSIFIFPEGTMNTTDQVLGNFYDGAFRIAIETQTPILPMVLHNARQLMPRNHPLHVKPGTITCEFLPPVAVAGLTLDELPQLKEQVKQLMEKHILANS
jgi:1-acyl-sn-glycerol-3-phosphate acyltransferase